MLVQAIKTEGMAIRMLFSNKLTLLLIVMIYGALLGVGYLFVSTREATITQLVVTLAVVVVAPVLFFVLQAVSVNYASDQRPTSLIRKVAFDALRLVAVTVPLIVVTALVFWGLGKIDSHLTIATTLRYLLIGVIAPLLMIQLWVAASRSGLRQLLRRAPQTLAKAFAPQSVFVYACGFLLFAVAPYLLVFHTTQTDRVWLEVSLLAVRLTASALLILFGWVTTVGALSLTQQFADECQRTATSFSAQTTRNSRNNAMPITRTGSH